MNSFWRIFSLEFTAFVRSKSLAMLLAASVAWMFVAPLVFGGDGTEEGARQLTVHYSLGGVAALLSVVLLSSATGSIAAERASRRLQLTLVRPVRYTSIVIAKTAALTFAGAIVLAAAACVELVRQPLSRPCRHVLSPVLPTPQEEARAMYEAFVNDPSTSDAIKKTKKSVVLRFLAQRAFDRYETVGTNETAVWSFALPRDMALGAGAMSGMCARLRFTNDYDMRQDVRGWLAFDDGEILWSGCVSNITKAVVEVPLAASPADGERTPGALSFRNEGKSGLMLRPRRDVNLLVRADGFGWNLLRAYFELVAVFALLVSFGMFLGSALGRPVALFAAIAALVVSEMSPSVIEQYPDELEKDAIDAIGLHITRAVAAMTHPVSSIEPMAKLAEDTCVERREVVRVLVADMLLAPLVFAFLSSLVMPRKTYD